MVQLVKKLVQMVKMVIPLVPIEVTMVNMLPTNGSACADDVLFMTEDPEELQVMFAQGPYIERTTHSMEIAHEILTMYYAEPYSDNVHSSKCCCSVRIALREYTIILPGHNFCKVG